MSFFNSNYLKAQAPYWGGDSIPNAINYYNSVELQESYYDSTGLDTVSGSGYKSFHRFQSAIGLLAGGVIDHGGLTLANSELKTLFSTPNLICNGNPNFPQKWEFVGHRETKQNKWTSGQGIVTTVHVDEIHDNTLNTIYLGTANSGLWKTTNATSSKPNWVCLTDNVRLPMQGVSGIVISPNNQNTIYVTTGCWRDKDHAIYSIGLLKSTDGGNTWLETPLTYDLNNPTQYAITQKIFLAPWSVNGNDVLYVFRQNEIHFSEDGGNSFTMIRQLADPKMFWRDLIFLNNSEIMLSADGYYFPFKKAPEVWKSTLNGISSNATWSDITSSVFSTTGSSSRIDLAIYNANKNYIYAAWGHFTHIVLGKSINGGTNWTTNVPILPALGQYPKGARAGDQFNDILVSKNNPNVLYHCNTTMHKSINGGSSFTQLFTYTSGDVHPDVRDGYITSNGQGQDLIYAAHDGGLSYAVDPQQGSDFISLNGLDLQISETMGVGVSLNEDWIATGLFDIGWYDKRGNTEWENFVIGDGFKVLYDPYRVPDRMIVGSNKWFRAMSRTENNPEYLYNGDWDKEITIDSRGNYYYGGEGRLDVVKNESNSGNSKNHFRPRNLPNFNDYVKVSAIAPAPSDPNILYFGYQNPTWSNQPDFSNPERFFKSSNNLSANPTATDLSGKLDFWGRGLTDIAVDPNNANHVWVCQGSGFDKDGKRIRFSTDGGNNFNMLLAPIKYCDGNTIMPWPINKIIIDDATGGMYAGTDIGVFYNSDPKNASSEWIYYNRDLPIARITQMTINYCSRKLYVSTYGRGLYACDLAENPTENLVIETPNYLNIPTDNIRIFNANITIPTGKTMTVNGTVKMAAGRTITVQPGARLTIDGGTITSTCDVRWGGIILEGNRSLPQVPQSNQGVVIIYNQGTISNANIGIHLIGLNSDGSFNWNKTGGIVSTLQANFKNNRRDVAFMSYKNMANNIELPNQSQFWLTRFETDNNNLVPNHLLQGHVSMWDVYGVKIYGCTFEDKRSLDPEYSYREGIVTSNSSYTVDQFCLPQPCAPGVGAPSQFKNLKLGIRSTFSRPDRDIIIRNSSFNGFSGSLITKNDGNSHVRDNSYIVPHRPIVPFKVNYPFGHYLNESTGFYVHNNIFQGTGDASNQGSAGLVIKNSGGDNNQFHVNYFNDLRIGSQALGQHKVPNIVNEYTGLTFRCNDYNDNRTDFDIRDYTNSNLATNLIGIKRKQGQLPNGGFEFLDNLFGNSSPILFKNIDNQSGNPIDYIHRDNKVVTNRYYPYDVNNVSRFQEVYVNGANCLIETDYGDEFRRMPLEQQMGIYRPELEIIHDSLIIVCYGGDRDTLMKIVDEVDENSKETVIDVLNDISPNLSDEILVKIAGLQTPFSDLEIFQILYANPHSSRNPQIIEILLNRTPLFPMHYIDDLLLLQNTYTLYDTLRDEVSYLLSVYDDIVKELIFSYSNDTLESVENFDHLFDHPIYPTFHYQLADIYFEKGNQNQFNTIVQNIPNKISLRQDQKDFHDDFIDCYNQFWEWKNNENEVFGDTAKRDWLLNFAANHSNTPNRLHGYLAYFDTFLTHPMVVIGDSYENNSEQMAQPNTEIKEDAKNYQDITVYPNPTKDKITLAWKSEPKDAEVKIYNLYGTLMDHSTWDASTPISFDVSGWRQGAYIVEIQTQTETIKKYLLIHR